MLILILIHVQYSQNAVFSFEKRLDHQNHSSSGSHHPVKLPPPQRNFMGEGGIYPPLLTAIWKTLWTRLQAPSQFEGFKALFNKLFSAISK